MARPALGARSPGLRARALLVSLGLMAALLAGCTTRRAERPRWAGTLVVWDGPRGQVDGWGWLREQARAFMDANPGVRVEVVEVAWEEMAARVASARQSGQLPDLAAIRLGEGLTVEEAASGSLEALDAALSAEDLSDFYPAALAAYRTGGKLLGLPLTVRAPFLLLNSDIFRERGVALPADGRWTWEEFRAAVQNLTFDRPSASGTTSRVYGFGAAAGPGEIGLLPFLPIESWLSGSEEGLSAAAAALDRLASLKLSLGALHPLTGTDQAAVLAEAFRGPGRTLAITPGDLGLLRQLNASDAPGLSLRVAAYPGDGRTSTLADVGGYVVFAQRDAGRRAAAVELLKMITGAAAQGDLTRTVGSFPARVSAAPSFNDPELARAVELIRSAQPLGWRPGWPAVEARLVQYVSLALTGELSAEEAVRQALFDIRNVGSSR